MGSLLVGDYGGKESSVVLFGNGDDYRVCGDDDNFALDLDLELDLDLDCGVDVGKKKERVWWGVRESTWEREGEGEMEIGEGKRLNVDVDNAEDYHALGGEAAGGAIRQESSMLENIRGSLISVVSSEIHIVDDEALPLEENSNVTGDLRLPWIWVEGWRARLRMSGDVVEKSRWEWRMDDKPGMRVVNKVPLIVATIPGFGGGLDMEGDVWGPRRKSFHWA